MSTFASRRANPGESAVCVRIDSLWTQVHHLGALEGISRTISMGQLPMLATVPFTHLLRLYKAALPSTASALQGSDRQGASTQLTLHPVLTSRFTAVSQMQRRVQPTTSHSDLAMSASSGGMLLPSGLPSPLSSFASQNQSPDGGFYNVRTPKPIEIDSNELTPLCCRYYLTPLLN